MSAGTSKWNNWMSTLTDLDGKLSRLVQTDWGCSGNMLGGESFNLIKNKGIAWLKLTNISYY